MSNMTDHGPVTMTIVHDDQTCDHYDDRGRPVERVEHGGDLGTVIHLRPEVPLGTIRFRENAAYNASKARG